jgi:serine phosphatase RsbU (regulator of sigma subunit)/putative methionine-R-sulfoxide reductase with GAF domain
VIGGAVGWIWLALSGPGGVSINLLTLFLVLALLVEIAGFRVPPSDPHSLVGIVLLTAALTLGPVNGALVAALSGLMFGVILPVMYGGARSVYVLVGRPFLRSGVRVIAVLVSAAVAGLFAGGVANDATFFLALLICFPLTIQINRMLREYLQGGWTGVVTWWRSAWRAVISAEILPLPIAWLGVAVYRELGIQYFLMGAAALLATSLTVRRAGLNLQRQRRSARELARLNEVSRAIIRAEMDVFALGDLIYREASKVVDTSSFHLGIFDEEGDQYTLIVRVQDRVRLPPLSLQLPAGDGIIGWMRETGQSLLVHDFATEMDDLPARPRYQSDLPPRSGIYVPLTVGEVVIGSISIQSYRPNAFEIDDLRLLSLIADQAAVAIAKARAYDQAHGRAVQLQAIHEVGERIAAILDLEELLPSVVRLIRERFGYHPVHVFTVEADGRLIFRASTAEPTGLERLRDLNLYTGDGVVGAAAAQGQPILINDVLEDPRYISDDSHTRAELAVPLRFGDETLGVLDVQSAEAGRFTSSDLFVMQTLAGQIAVAIEGARAFEAQREEAWTLNALLQVAENLGRATTLDELLPSIVRLPPLLLGCDRCYCLAWDSAQQLYTPLAAYGLSPAQRARFLATPIEDRHAPLLADARQTTTFVAVKDAAAQPTTLPDILEPFGGGTLLALPLHARGSLLGMLITDYTDREYSFTPRSLTLYTGIANQIAAALESALLAQEAMEAAHLEEELRVARDIQRALLPSSVPVIPGWQIAADWRSARLVGGDFYDFWRLAGNREQGTGNREQGEVNSWPPTPDPWPLGFVIADVSDKGVPAAMFMALSRSLTRAAALDSSPPPMALTRANRWIIRDSESAMFVTIFYGILDVEQGTLRYTCAGHNPPLLISADGAVRELTTPGIALGVLEEVTLVEAEASISVGDVLVCYTDGITEATNSVDEPFGVPRLTSVVQAHREQSADAIIEAIMRSLLAFTGERPPFDDITLVVIKRTGEG